MSNKKKKQKSLTKKEVEVIVDDRTSFSKTLSIHTGLEANTSEDGVIHTEEEQSLAEDDIVVVQYNKKVRKRITKYIKQILTMRGVKDAENITAGDSEVRDLLRKWTKRQKKRFISTQEKNAQINIYIEAVSKKHRPHYLYAVFQLFAWAIIYDDIFDISGGSINCRLDVEVPEDYWEQKISEDEDIDLDLDSLLGDDYTAPEMRFDRTNPFEIMIAIITQFLDQHETLSEELQELFSKMFASITLIGSNKKFDDAGFLHAELDKLLSNDDDEGSDSE